MPKPRIPPTEIPPKIPKAVANIVPINVKVFPIFQLAVGSAIVVAGIGYILAEKAETLIKTQTSV